jgi:hypothetical protein
LHKVVLLLIGAAGATAVAQPIEPSTVSRIGDYVERYYARAQSLVTEETVTLQPMGSNSGFAGFSRKLVYELRIEWDPEAVEGESPAKMTRQLLRVNGKPPRPKDEPKCEDPGAVSPEPLAFLLNDRRHKFSFRSAGVGEVDGRAAVRIDYRSRMAEPPQVSFKDKDECASFDLPGTARGRIWADAQTSEILRLDEGLTAMVEVRIPRAQQLKGLWPPFVTIERADTSIRYRRVSFDDPDERLMLPTEITTMIAIRSNGSSQRRVTQTFANYRRFITASRIVQ